VAIPRGYFACFALRPGDVPAQLTSSETHRDDVER
jgi:hypothetical protein